jgi:Uma2 family endonuclease
MWWTIQENDAMQPAVQRPPIPPLRAGERLTQPEFHRRYEAHPDDTKFELIGGVVYVASPLLNPHGRMDSLLSFVLVYYEGATPGTETMSNVTNVLGPESEPQPDELLRILPSHGGRTHDEENRTHDGPELVAQISHTTLSLDLGARRRDNEEAGVIEYLVVDIPGQRLHWFDLRAGNEIPLRGGVMRSRVFPGLWIAPDALFSCDVPALTATIQQGIASSPHAKFVARLERARQRLARSSGQS